MKKLVIGGSGFVGSVIVEKLLERGFEVIVFDNLRFGNYKNIENLPVQFINGDVLNPTNRDKTRKVNQSNMNTLPAHPHAYFVYAYL